MSTTIPSTYPDPEYEAAHRATYERIPRYPITPVLPPGITHEVFAKAIQAFISVLGPDAVLIDSALSDYIDPYDLHEHEAEAEATENKNKRRKVPSAAVLPNSTDQLAAILKIANEFQIPLWTFSRGKNLGYGGPAPRVNGSVALDLHQMNKILEVNDQFHYAVVEPGVTFVDLYRFCVEHKKKAWLSTASLGWGSVMGNVSLHFISPYLSCDREREREGGVMLTENDTKNKTLDRGTGFGALFTHHQFIAGLEVMLASGDLVRTGQWGITANNSPNAFISKFTYGPSIEGLFLQSNLGVVTKMSIWLQPQPQAFMSCSFSMPHFDDLECMVDAFGEMRRNGTIPSCVWFTSLIETLCISGRREDYWKGTGPIPDWRLEELRLETGYGHWYARFGLYGPKRVVEAQFEEIKAVLAKKAPTGTIAGTLYADEENGVNAAEVPVEHGSIFVGVPQLWSLPLINWPIPKSKTDGKAAHGDYAPVIPSSGKLVLEWMKKSKPICEENGVELMADFFMHERHMVLMNMFTWDQTDPVQKHKIKNLYYGLHELAKEKGYGMYRAHVNHMGEC